MNVILAPIFRTVSQLVVITLIHDNISPLAPIQQPLQCFNVNHRTEFLYPTYLRNLNLLRRHLRCRLREYDCQNTILHRCFDFAVLFCSQ
jgi:hypothetical protein